jgi:uncharacterized protein DUF3857
VLPQQLIRTGGFTACRFSFYTALEIAMKHTCTRMTPLLDAVALCFLFAVGWRAALAQEPQQKPSGELPTKNAEKAAESERASNPAQIELLETKVRFESNGDSRKEVHALVKINSELGVRQFAQLNFDFNRSFESIEIPLVHITHASGGTADILPSAITDRPNPAVVNAPAYQDVRVKSVRILGLQPGDTLEYRVVRTVSHHPLAPDFWLDHTFDRTGVVTHETFELDLPASRNPEVRINPNTLPASTDKSGEGENARVTYRWDRKNSSTSANGSSSNGAPDIAPTSDVALSTFGHWRTLSMKLADALTPGATTLDPQKPREERLQELSAAPKVPESVLQKAKELTASVGSDSQKTEAIYDFVSKKVETVDLPLGATGFSVRTADAILSSGYAIQEDKFVLFDAFAKAVGLGAMPVLTGFSDIAASTVPMPSVFKHLVLIGGGPHYKYWMDPSLQIAPFGLILPIHEKFVFLLNRGIHMNPAGPSYSIDSIHGVWTEPSTQPPFPEFQKVSVDASVGSNGKLTAKVHYSMRGDNELLLRMAFHQTLKEKWNEVAQLLSITDGFRGQVTSVNASDPYATKEPFTVDYELDQPKFVDWSKKTVRIPALLPQLGLPDSPAKPASGSATAAIELGTPLEVETEMTLHLPPGTEAQTPTGTSVERDYATYASKYSARSSTVTASRRIHFLLREIPGARAADYNAFLRAVQSDEAQDFTLESAPSAPKTNSAAPHSTTPPKPTTLKP